MRPMRRVLWLLPLLALAGCKDKTSQGAVRLTVTYEGFRPGCVRVLARDTISGEELSQEVEGKGERTGDSLLVGVLPPDDWGSTVEVSAQAYERACSDPQPVVSNSERVTLTRGQATPATLRLLASDEDQDGYVAVLSGGTDCRDDQPAINPGATERCNEVDDNCNGQPDTAELRLGQSCTNAQSCSGTFRCGEGGEVICSVPNAILAYPDVDQDGRGDRNASPSSFCNGVPGGYVTSPADDCDDTRASVRPGVPERCNDVDDNCDGNLNEGFPAPNTACTDAATQCAGLFACDSVSGNAVCQLTQTPQNWVMDADGDGFGSGAAVRSCVSPGPGYVTQGGDCNDGNRFTFPGATELCDQEDNNCDNQPESSTVCPTGGPRWVSRTVGNPVPTWRSVFTATPGDVGVVGSADSRARLAPGSSTFESTTDGCGNNNSGWNTLWVDMANNGRSYFGSTGGRLVFQDRTSATCSQQHDLDLWVRGLVGIRNGANLEVHGVTSTSSASNEGSTFLWNGAGTLTPGTTRVAPLYDVHGVSRNALFAVGGHDEDLVGPISPRIYRFNAGTGQWQRETLPDNLGDIRLRGVWVVNERLAFAVGEASTVLMWNGTAWSKMAFPNNVENLVSVVAFGASSAFAAAYNGRIYRYNGQSWQQFHDDTSARFNDIAGTSPADLWVVGENGLIVHWPD